MYRSVNDHCEYRFNRMYVCMISMIILAISVQAQPQCACSCCLGQYCQPLVVGILNSPNCSRETCLAQCRCSYSQCAASYPYGLVSTQCSSVDTLFSCECQCCNSNSVTCTPTFIGYSTSASCQISSCSIACYTQYPAQCVSGPKGQTYGLCVGPITTTTTTTIMTPWLGNLCSCSFCPPGSTSCQSNTLLGVISASQCSSSACTQACQSRYQLGCTVTYLNQINGVCLSQMPGKTTCKCNCCGGYSCIDYELNTNETCSSCYTKCLQVSPCINPLTIRDTCVLNNSMIMTNPILSMIILLIIITVIF